MQHKEEKETKASSHGRVVMRTPNTKATKNRGKKTPKTLQTGKGKESETSSVAATPVTAQAFFPWVTAPKRLAGALPRLLG